MFPSAWLGRVLQHLGRPLVQALACRLCSYQCATMDLGRHTQQQSAGRGLLGVNALRLAVRQIVFDREFKLSPQLRHRFATETDDVANAENPANEQIPAAAQRASHQHGFDHKPRMNTISEGSVSAWRFADCLCEPRTPLASGRSHSTTVTLSTCFCCHRR